MYDHDPPELQKLKDQVEPIMSEGIELFKAGLLNAALLKFQTAQTILSQDLPLRFLFNSLKEAIEQGRTGKGEALLDFR